MESLARQHALGPPPPVTSIASGYASCLLEDGRRISTVPRPPRCARRSSRRASSAKRSATSSAGGEGRPGSSTTRGWTSPTTRSRAISVADPRLQDLDLRWHDTSARRADVADHLRVRSVHRRSRRYVSIRRRREMASRRDPSHMTLPRTRPQQLADVPSDRRREDERGRGVSPSMSPIETVRTPRECSWG